MIIIIKKTEPNACCIDEITGYMTFNPNQTNERTNETKLHLYNYLFVKIEFLFSSTASSSLHLLQPII